MYCTDVNEACIVVITSCLFGLVVERVVKYARGRSHLNGRVRLVLGMLANSEI